MTILAENIGSRPQMYWGAGVPGDDPCPPKVVARDVFCPDGHHLMTQEWSLTELRQLLDTNSPVFFCEKHAYRWNPDVLELEALRRLTNECDGGGLP